MNVAHLLFLFLLTGTTLPACTGNKKIQEPTGNDFEKLIKKLHKEPGNEKYIAEIKSVYAELQDEHLQRIEELKKTDLPESNEKIVKEYASLQELFEDIHAVPGLGAKINPTSYQKILQSSRNQIIRQLSEESNTLLKQGDKTSCRQAYYRLLKLLNYSPLDNSIEEKIRQTMLCAATCIAIEEPVIDTRFSHYNSIAGTLSRDLIETLKEKNLSPFLSVENGSPLYDETITLHFTHFETGTQTKDKNSREVVNNTPYTTGGRRATTTVSGTTPSSATITTTKISSVSSAKLQMEILGNTGQTLIKQEFTAQYEWSNEMNSYSGDRRALTQNDRAQLRNNVKTQPTENEMAEELMKQLKEKILNFFQNRYGSL